MSQAFTGRGAELALLAGCWERASSGTPTCVLVHGESGIGKTSLLRAFTSSLLGVRTVLVSGDEAETALPYGLHDQVMQGLARSTAESAATSTGERPQAEGAVDLRNPWLEGAALLLRLSAAQESGPAALLVDDIHLADIHSLTSLTYALRRLRTERLLVLFASPSNAQARLPRGLRRLIDADGRRITLQGLSSAEVQALGTVIGLGALSDRAAHHVRDHTGGNPLHLQALFSDITLKQAESTHDPLPTPRSVALLVAGALHNMSQPARQLAAAAAVLGTRCWLRDAAELSGVDDCLLAVEELKEAQIADLEQQRYGRQLAFVHPIVRAAVYDDVRPVDRVELHRRAADICSGAESLQHSVRAATGFDPLLTARLTDQATADRRVGAFGAAADALLNAVTLAGPGTRRDQLLVDAVDMLLLDGDLIRAGAIASEVTQQPEDANSLRVLARLAWLVGRHHEAQTLGEAAWDVADDDGAGGRSDIAAMLSQLHLMRGDGVGALRWAERASAAGVVPPDVSAASRSTAAIGLALIGRAQDGMDMLSGPCAASGDAEFTPERGARGMLRLWTDDLPGARADLRTSLPDPEVLPEHVLSRAMQPYRLTSVAFLAETEYRCGDWDTATALADQAVSLVETTGQVWLSALAHSVASFVPAARGQWKIAAIHVASAQRAAAETGDRPSYLYAHNAAVHLAACRGDTAGVISLSEPLLAESVGPQHEPGIFRWSVQHVSALVSLARFDEAKSRLSVLEKAASARGSKSQLAAVSRVTGEMAAARRDVPAARQAFEAALLLGEQAGDALESAMAQASYGVFLRRRGERRSAHTRLTTAQRMFTVLGATPFLQSVERELAACGAERQDGDLPHRQLTPQESVVAELVCRGRSNQQVAEELSLSIKTVTYHLGHVYTKTGVASRTQLIAKLGTSVGDRRT